MMPTDSNQSKGYQAAIDTLTEQFQAADPRALAALCGAECDDDVIRLAYLGRTYTIAWPDGRVSLDGFDNEALAPVKILLLNYILNASRRQPTGELIAFRDIPGAATYEPSFRKRAENPLVRTFDGKPGLLYSASERIGGTKANVADASVRLRVLPLLEVTYAVWHSDEEFPAKGTVLFDSSTRSLMSAECMVVASSNGVYELMRAAREITQEGKQNA